ncbi:MAG TPA: MjaI family restriction endonuclease [Methanothermococcus okinawensis]|nr:MjaI family restriction endonuclease [Methanothermococcus okinawensis]
MAKEWILNMATNRWRLNRKNSVGPVSQWIRECKPKTVVEWEEFYYKKLEEFLKSKGIDLRKVGSNSFSVLKIKVLSYY